MLSRLGVPQALVRDNRTQLTDKNYQDFAAKLDTKLHFTFVKHHQNNVQFKVANMVIMQGLKWRLGDAKNRWVE